MNLGAATVVLRPRTLAEVLDLACRFCFSGALGLFARLAAAVLLPSLAACLALRHALGWGYLGVWAVAVLLATALQGVFTIAVSRLLFAEQLGVRQALGLFARRLGSYAGALLGSRLLLALAALPALIGLVLVWPRVLFVHEASLLEGAAPVDAIRRAGRFAVSSGNALGALFALLATQIGIVLAAELLGQGLVDDVLQLGRPFGGLFSHGGSPYALAGFFLSVPYVATARFLGYIDARTRADAWDVQLRFMNIAAKSSAEERA